MELSKITVCRQDIVVLSDTESYEEGNVKKKKKSKTKIECLRKVKLTSITTKRIVPLCCRRRCKNARNHHRVTSKNTKYTNTRKTKTPRNQKGHCKRNKNKDETVPRVLCSPITVESSSDTYEDISECSFNIMSSDSDEIEELIKATRKRMKEESVRFRHSLVNSEYSSVSLDDIYEDIFSENETYSSLHSMDTIIIEREVPIPSPLTPKHSDDDNIENKSNIDIKPILICRENNNNNNDFVYQTSSQDKNIELSSVYEIPGSSPGSLMEHYLNSLALNK